MQYNRPAIQWTKHVCKKKKLKKLFLLASALWRFLGIIRSCSWSLVLYSVAVFVKVRRFQKVFFSMTHLPKMNVNLSTKLALTVRLHTILQLPWMGAEPPEKRLEHHRLLVTTPFAFCVLTYEPIEFSISK